MTELNEFLDTAPRLDGEKAERVKEGTTDEAPSLLAASPPPVLTPAVLNLPLLCPYIRNFSLGKRCGSR